MTINVPHLDDRTEDDLRRELIARIPVFAPEWTDHNDSDPGIALLQLFAHLAKGVQQRVNAVPDATFRAFLRLLDIRTAPAQSARGIVALTSNPRLAPLLDAGTELKAGAIPFTSSQVVRVLPVELRAVTKVTVAAASSPGEARRQQYALGQYGVDNAADARFVEFHTLPEDVEQAGALTLAPSAAADDSLWIAVLLAKDGDAQSLHGAVLSVGVVTDDLVTSDPLATEPAREDFDLARAGERPGERFRCRGLDDVTPTVSWRIWHDGADPAGFSLVEVVGDTTRGLTRGGVMQVHLPATVQPWNPAPRGAAPPAGVSVPPVLDDARLASRVVGWLQARRIPTTAPDPIARIRWIGANATEVVQRQQTKAPELVGVGNGDAYQGFSLHNGDVLATSIELHVEERLGRFRWTLVEDFVGTRADDRHFVLSDPAQGRIRFGPHKRPMFGERITASYSYGGGRKGVVPAKSITSVTRRPTDPSAECKAANPVATWGGADAETETEAIERIPRELQRRDRAVTAEDFRDLAASVAGVGRAETLAAFHPDVRTQPAAGAVTVIVWPDLQGVLRAPAQFPMPEQQLLRAVCSTLDARRLLTTELFVVPPTYVRLVVSLSIQVEPGARPAKVHDAVNTALRDFLSPLSPGGPAGSGWPLGRTVRAPELSAHAVRVDGVEYVRELRMSVRVGANWVEVDEGFAYELDRWEVPALDTLIVVTTGTAPAPFPPTAQPTPSSGTVLVPLPAEVC